MPSTSSAEHLRQRAERLRRLATRLEACGAVSLSPRADAATWLGPTADRCQADLVAGARRVLCAAALLRDTAVQLDRHALQCELAASRDDALVDRR